VLPSTINGTTTTLFWAYAALENVTKQNKNHRLIFNTIYFPNTVISEILSSH